MAKNFNNGVIVYDAQVERFDMIALPAENIEFPQGVMKKLDYFGDEVLYGWDPSFQIQTIRQGELGKLASMGHIQAAKDFTDAAALAAEQARVALRGQLEGYADTAEADAKDYTDAREVVLQGNIDSEETRALAAEAANALAHSTFKTAQETFNGDIGMEVTTNKTERIAADAVLQAGLDTEISDRIAAVNGVTVSLATEAATARAAEQANAAAITAEKVRAEAAELGLQGSINEVTVSLATEASTARAAEQANAAAIAAEKTRAEAAELVLEQSIAAEATLARQEEGVLATAINSEKGRIDAILAASTADADSFKEIVDLINSVDTENDAAFASHVLDFNAAKTALELADTNEASARAAGDIAIQNDLDAYKISNDAAVLAEKTRAETAEGNLQGSLDTEEAARIAGDVAIRGTSPEGAVFGGSMFGLDQAMATKEAASIAADAVLTADLAAQVAKQAADETARDVAIAAAKVVADAALASEVSRAEGAEAVNAAAINTEKLRAEGVEGQLAVLIGDEELARENADSAIRGSKDGVEFAGSMQGLSDAVDGEKLRAEAAEAVNAAAVVTEKQRAEAAELALSNGLSAEQQRATTAEGLLDGKIDQEIADRTAADTTAASFNLAARNAIQADVDANEASASGSFADALAARGVIAGNLAQELLDRAAGDVQVFADAKSYTDAEISDLTALLDAEILATNADFLSAEQARVGLQGNIDVEKGRIDAILAGADADKDSFAEIVALVNSVDTENDTAFAGHVSAYNTKMGLLDGVDAAATTDRAAIRSELASEKAALQAEFAAADVVVSDAFATADLAMKLELQADIADEIAARVAGDQAEVTARAAAISAEESARIAGDNALTASLNAEVTRATGVETQLQSKITDMHDGETTVKFFSNAIASASIMMVAGFAHQIVVNSGASAMATLPVMGPNFKMTLNLAASSSESMEFHAPAGMVIDGEADGKITLHPGSSVTFLENAGVYYMV